MKDFKTGDMVTPIKFDNIWVRKYYRRGNLYRVKDIYGRTFMKVFTINNNGEEVPFIVPRDHFKLYKKSVIL